MRHSRERELRPLVVRPQGRTVVVLPVKELLVAICFLIGTALLTVAVTTVVEEQEQEEEHTERDLSNVEAIVVANGEEKQVRGAMTRENPAEAHEDMLFRLYKIIVNQGQRGRERLRIRGWDGDVLRVVVRRGKPPTDSLFDVESGNPAKARCQEKIPDCISLPICHPKEFVYLGLLAEKEENVETSLPYEFLVGRDSLQTFACDDDKNGEVPSESEGIAGIVIAIVCLIVGLIMWLMKPTDVPVSNSVSLRLFRIRNLRITPDTIPQQREDGLQGVPRV